MRKVYLLLIILTILLSFGCKKKETNIIKVHLLHQMEPAKRPVLKELIREFERKNSNIKVITLAKGTEELHTGYQAAAAFTGGGPELVYGPMDQIGPFEVMKLKDSEQSIILPLGNIFSKEFFDKFSELVTSFTVSNTGANKKFYQVRAVNDE